jgi:hypothetical protein
MTNLKPFEAIVLTFAEALIKGDNERAYELLVPALKEIWSPEALAERFVQMWQGYSDGNAEYAVVDEQISMQDWPDKQMNDAGWCYAGIIGSDFSEAVIAIVTDIDGELLIRELEWGRP